MSRHEVAGSIRCWDLGELGELHEIEDRDRRCEVHGSTRDSRGRCPGSARYVWAAAGRCDVHYCSQHGRDTFPEAKQPPSSGRPLPP